MNKIIKINSITNKPSIEFYIAWDTKTNNFYHSYKECILLGGVWDSEYTAEQNSPSSCKIIHIDMTNNIPIDILRIIDKKDIFGGNTNELIKMKLRQLIHTFIFNNKEMKDQLKERYKDDI